MTAATPEVDSDADQGDYFGKQPESTDLHAAQRPKLETILSSDAGSTVDLDGTRPDDWREEGSSLSKRLYEAAERSETQSGPARLGREQWTGASIDSGLAVTA